MKQTEWNIAFFPNFSSHSFSQNLKTLFDNTRRSRKATTSFCLFGQFDTIWKQVPDFFEWRLAESLPLVNKTTFVRTGQTQSDTRCGYEPVRIRSQELRLGRVCDCNRHGRSIRLARSLDEKREWKREEWEKDRSKEKERTTHEGRFCPPRLLRSHNLGSLHVHTD